MNSNINYYPDLPSIPKSIGCVHSYLKAINTITKSIPNAIFYYRGHFRTTYELQPSIGRNKDIEKEYFDRYESDVFNRFKCRYKAYGNFTCNDDMDVLFIAQHYGLPTRLLDWTLNPLVALFFACYDDKEQKSFNGEVIVRYIEEEKNKGIPLLQSEKQKTTLSDIQRLSEDLIIIPDYIDQRLINQKALFQLFHNPLTIDDNPSYKIMVPNKFKKNILRELSKIGNGVDFIYPTLDRMCEYLKMYKSL